MKKLTYPLFCRRLGAEHIVAQVLGTEYETVGSDMEGIKSYLSHFLEQRRRTKEVAVPVMEKVKLRQVDVKLHPTYREEERVFAAVNPVRLSVHALYGESEFGFHCYLPFFGGNFYFYEISQLKELVEHFVRDTLHRASPEAVHRYLPVGEFFLDEVQVKDKDKPARYRGEISESFGPTLSSIAVRLPRSRKAEKNLELLPQNAWERSKEVERLAKGLIHEESSMLIIGEPGSGKTNLIMGAIRAAKNLEPKNPTTFWRTTAHRIIASARYLGEWQEICENLVQELERANGVLWIMDLLNLFSIGGEGPEDSVAAFLRPFMSNGSLRIVAEATPAELEAARRILPDFTSHFQTLFLEELDEQRMLNLLNLYKEQATRSLRIEVSDDGLDLAYVLLKRYERYRSFPGKAVQFLQKCLSIASLDERNLVDRNHIIQAFINRTGLPESLLRDEIILKDADLRNHFSEHIKGQGDALEKMVSVVKIFKTGLNNPDRPIASLLFSGPTGTGKTACARALAAYFFGEGQKKDPMIRIDMSEFQHPDQIDRLIGGGAGRPGKLVSELRERPFAVVLLDEIEKAHPSFFDVLLSVLDQGVLTDSLGRVTDFRNTIIVMTSNLGSEKRPAMGFESEPNPDFLKSIKGFFRPEFFNRIDHVVIFNQLSEESLKAIAVRELANIASRDGLVARNIRLRFSEQLIKHLTDIGYDPRYGARPLSRAIERTVVSGLARFLLDNRELRDVSLGLDFGEDLEINRE